MKIKEEKIIINMNDIREKSKQESECGNNNSLFNLHNLSYIKLIIYQNDN